MRQALELDQYDEHKEPKNTQDSDYLYGRGQQDLMVSEKGLCVTPREGAPGELRQREL